VVDSGWYPVAANYSGAIVRVERRGGDGPTLVQTGFVIDGALVHPKYAGEALLVLYASRPKGEDVLISARPPRRGAPSSTVPADTAAPGSGPDDKILLAPPPRPPPTQPVPADTAAPGTGTSDRILPVPNRDAQGPPPSPQPPPDEPPPAPPVAGPAPVPEDTLAPGGERAPQMMAIEGQKDPGPLKIGVVFPALDPRASLTATELVWRRPPQAASEPLFEIWRLSGKPPFGAKLIAESDIGCNAPAFGQTIAMLGVGLTRKSEVSPTALALNISEMIDGTDASSMIYTHSTNKASGGAPVFDLATGHIFAVHIGSHDDPGDMDRRLGEATSLPRLLNIIRAGIDTPQPPLCSS
jgi:hypothetical protein